MDSHLILINKLIFYLNNIHDSFFCGRKFLSDLKKISFLYRCDNYYQDLSKLTRDYKLYVKTDDIKYYIGIVEFFRKYDNEFMNFEKMIPNQKIVWKFSAIYDSIRSQFGMTKEII